MRPRQVRYLRCRKHLLVGNEIWLERMLAG
jgi:hypothetical protein